MTKLPTETMSIHTIHRAIKLCRTCFSCYLNSFHFTAQSEVKVGRWMSFLFYKWGEQNLGRRTVMLQSSRVISRCFSSLPLLKSWLDGPQQSHNATPTHPFAPTLKGELRCSPMRDVLFKTDLPHQFIAESTYVPREYFKSTYSSKTYKLWG